MEYHNTILYIFFLKINNLKFKMLANNLLSVVKSSIVDNNKKDLYSFSLFNKFDI